MRHTLICVKVLIFHGYLLRGTGSNVYNASLARALARLAVHVDGPGLDLADQLAVGPGSQAKLLTLAHSGGKISVVRAARDHLRPCES